MTDIHLVLAHGPRQPEGHVGDRLELDLPLLPNGALDEAMVASSEVPPRGRRIREDGSARDIELVPLGGGVGLRGRGDEDEPVWALDGRLFRPGEYVTLRRPDGQTLSFRVVQVGPPPLTSPPQPETNRVG